MNQIIYERLKDIARQGKTTTYAEIAILGDWEIGEHAGLLALVKELEEIAEHEIGTGRPLLVIIVLSGDLNRPGKGLFSWAKKKGLYSGDDLSFFVSELRNVHEYWNTSPV